MTEVKLELELLGFTGEEVGEEHAMLREIFRNAPYKGFLRVKDTYDSILLFPSKEGEKEPPTPKMIRLAARKDELLRYAEDIGGRLKQFGFAFEVCTLATEEEPDFEDYFGKEEKA